VAWGAASFSKGRYPLGNKSAVATLGVRRSGNEDLSVERVAFEGLLEKINSRSAVVSVLGLGYVGLPLAIAFAKGGFRVIGIDVDGGKVDSLHRCEPYIEGVSGDTLAELMSSHPESSTNSRSQDNEHAHGSLTATVDFNVLGESDVVIVCVPTPLSKTRNPDVSFIISAVEEIAQRLRPGMLVVLESTTYPGTTVEELLPILARSQRNVQSVGKGFFLAYSPERIDPGRKDWTVQNTPKIVGGVTSECTYLAKALYEHAVQQVVPVSSPIAAEMVKLLENTFRAVNIALVNEMAIMCDRLGVDVWEVINAAKTKPFGYMPFYPGPGLGGHCLPVDPQFLAWKMKTLSYNARIIYVAEEINAGMPKYVLEKIANSLNEEGKPLKGSRVLVIGVTYKANVSDLRESPALHLIDLLVEKGVSVAYHDPYIEEIMVNGHLLKRSCINEKELAKADCVVIITPHEGYDWEWFAANCKLIVDTRNAITQVSDGSAKIVKLGGA